MNDPLRSLLDRALRRASLKAQAELKKKLLKAKAKRLEEAKRISTDFTGRLQDRSVFRRLLADDSLDAARFRWYFEHIETAQSLDHMRKLIDKRMNDAPTS